MSGPLLKDRAWVAAAFFLNNSSYLSKDDQDRRYFTTASLKFVDTSPGGNFAINPPPQFTRTADIQHKNVFSSSKGMGRYYSEAIDDNSQLINIRFGVASFNSLSTFFTGFYKSGAGLLARTGRGFDIAYGIGRVVGFVVPLYTMPLYPLVALIGYAFRFLAGCPSTKYYYLKPSMPLYWNAVQTMVNTMAVNRGIIPRIMGSPEVHAVLDNSKNDPTAMLTDMHAVLPEIFTSTKKDKDGNSSGGIDVYAIANRAQRMARYQAKKIEDAQEANQNISLDDILKLVYNSPIEDKPKNKSFNDYLKSWWNNELGTIGTGEADKDGKQKEVVTETRPSSDKNDSENSESTWQKFWKFYSAELDDGSAFATFRVDATGSTSESFSNSHTQSEIQGKINGISAASRNTNFSLEGGNITGAIGAIVDSVKRFGEGMLESIHLSGLVTLGGGAFVDIPDHWDQSTASLPRMSYTIKLISPYGNPLSQLLSIDIPLAMLLAGVLPMATGPQSYTSPFLLELYDQGKTQTRLGMIDSLSISRGTSNLSFNGERHAMAVDVNFSVVDLSTVMAMPITEGFSLNIADTLFTDDTVFTDYMSVLGAMSLPDQIYSIRKLKLNATRQLAHWNSFWSVSHFASYMGGNTWVPPSKLISAFYKGSNK